MLPHNNELEKDFLKALQLEIDLKKERIDQSEIHSIYFGGGTPSLLAPEAFFEILTRLKIPSGTEITLEANPEQLSFEKLQKFKQVGINRLSIGAQSFDDTLLKFLQRTHNASQTERVLEDASRAGIENISIDLMYDLPRQSLTQWRKTLKIAAALPITHLSLYNLQLEEGSLYFKKRKEIEPLMPDPETSLNMYQAALEELSLSGLLPYEISAFAKKGYYSRHNTSYWVGRPFLGLGPSAFSYDRGIRYRNPLHFKKYCEAVSQGIMPEDFHDILSTEDRIKELFAVELRLVQGVNLQIFQNRHGNIGQETQKSIDSLINASFIEIKQDSICLTAKGILFYDYVASELI